LEALQISFTISGIHTWFWLPPLSGFLVALFCSMVGISGAFLLLPLQLSYLGFTTPAVSPTNLLFNLIAIPGGVYRYWREGRMVWPLVLVIVSGTLPGTLAGWYIRTRYLLDPGQFRLFAGIVLSYIGIQLILDRFIRRQAPNTEATGDPGAPHAGHVAPAFPDHTRVEVLPLRQQRIRLRFDGRQYHFSVTGMLLLAFLVGIVGSIYGVGGGAIIAPFCILLFQLPLHLVAGAALASTLITSLSGVLIYSLLSAPAGVATQPDWALGGLFGIGGLAGMYLGARLQRRVPESVLKLGLTALLLSIGGYYLWPRA